MMLSVTSCARERTIFISDYCATAFPLYASADADVITQPLADGLTEHNCIYIFRCGGNKAKVTYADICNKYYISE